MEIEGDYLNYFLNEGKWENETLTYLCSYCNLINFNLKVDNPLALKQFITLNTPVRELCIGEDLHDCISELKLNTNIIKLNHKCSPLYRYLINRNKELEIIRQSFFKTIISVNTHDFQFKFE
jgi:hypothetical protein